MTKGIVKLLVLIIAIVLLPSSRSFASNNEIEKNLQENLKQSRALLEKAGEKLKAGDSAQKEISTLMTLSANIKASHLLLQEKFRAREEDVKTRGARALQRHQDMEEGYLKALTEYLNLIEGLHQSADGQPSAAGLLQTTEDIKKHLEKILPKTKRPIIGTLPYRNLNYPSKEPYAGLSIIPAYKGGNKTVSPDDTTSTEEAPISDEIAILAQSLNWSPVLIYEYVKNTIDTEWYWGCMKGAEETLRQKSGNDCDQATLFVALLRASGFPTRYVRGTIEFFPDISSAKNNLGIDDPSKIAKYFQKAGIPYKPLIAGGKISNFQIEHIWIESQIPYGNYRGAIIDDNDKTWLGLDTSIKVKGYTYNTPMDIFDQSAISNQLSVIRDEYLGSLQTQTPLEYIKGFIDNYLSQNQPGKTYSDFLRTRTLMPQVLGLLPNSMQFLQKTITNEYTQIPNELKHKVRFVASDPRSPASNSLFDITMDTMKLSNKQIAISYEPETVEDQEIIDSYDGLDNTPAYLVRLRPTLIIDGDMAAAGKDGLPMGQDHDLTIELISPNGTETITNTHITGNLTAIGITAGKADSDQLSAISEEDDAETILSKEAYRYIDRWNQAEDDLASLLHVGLSRPMPTLVTIGGVIDVTEFLDMPHGFEWKGVFVDARARAIEIVGAQGNTPSSVRQKTFMQLSALQSSILENRIFEDDFGVDSISTAKLIQTVGANGNTPSLVDVDKTNITTVLPTLPFDDSIKEDITNAVNQNLTVKVPTGEMTYKDWTGIGYIKENPVTGEAGYMLSGMIAGGMTAEQWAQNYLAGILGGPYTGKPSKGPVDKVLKITPTDRQWDTVGKQLPQNLAVLVLDKNSKPVEGAKVTFQVIAGGGNFGKNILGQALTTYDAPSQKNGIAKAPFVLGKKTSENPSYEKLDPNHTFDTQIGLNMVSAYAIGPSGRISTQGPFQAYGRPDAPVKLVKVLGEGNKALANNPGGSLLTTAVDQHGNPVSNIDLQMRALPAVSGEPLVLLPPNYRNIEFYRKEDCSNPYPIYVDCPTVGQTTVKTQYFGAVVNTMMGNTVNTRYTVNVSASVLPNGPVEYNLYSTGFRRVEGYIPPGLFVRSLVRINDNGEPINAAKVGTQLKAPLVAELLMLYDDYTMVGPYACGTQNTCWRMVTSGLVQTRKIPNGSVMFEASQGGGSVLPTVNLNNGQYSTKYTTGSLPAVNLVEATGAATVSAPVVLYDSRVNNVYIPNFSDTPASYDPLLLNEITEYPQSMLQCSNNECRLLSMPVTLKSGQQAIFYAGQPPVVVGVEQKANYTVYGVDTQLTVEPKYVIVDDQNYTHMDTTFSYVILPPEYSAVTADIDLNTVAQNQQETWLGSLNGIATQGAGKVIYVSGAKLDIANNYGLHLILNKGSDAEVKGDLTPLPVGQFKMFADDDTPLVGAVTDGAAKIRLQLTVKNNQNAFANLAWRIVDPQITNSQIGTGTLLDSGGTATAVMPVVFNSDGVAEAMYQAPDGFVRWTTPKETGDKDSAERTIQPTLDLVSYLLTGNEVLPTIRLKRPPVVLVHGLWGNDSAWDVFGPKFNDKGQYEVLKVDYSEDGLVSSIVTHAKTLKAEIKNTLKMSKDSGFAASKTDVIAHSMGGLLTRQYCFDNKTDCQNKIRRLITIATPHFGSELADLLLVYRDDRDNFPGPPLLPFCRTTVDRFIRGVSIPYVNYEMVEPHPIFPSGGAIDDLATGTLPPFMQSRTKTSMGRWADLPPLSNAISSHTIVGIAPANRTGVHPQIIDLWKVLSICGIGRDNLFGAEYDLNDRIVKESSQHGGIVTQATTVINSEDHYSIRNSDATINVIRKLLNDPAGSSLFTK